MDSTNLFGVITLIGGTGFIIGVCATILIAPALVTRTDRYARKCRAAARRLDDLTDELAGLPTHSAVARTREALVGVAIMLDH